MTNSISQTQDLQRERQIGKKRQNIFSSLPDQTILGVIRNYCIKAAGFFSLFRQFCLQTCGGVKPFFGGQFTAGK